MQTLDLTPANGEGKFIPTHVLGLSGWEEINKRGENFVEDMHWLSYVTGIVKISEEITVVFWTDTNEGGRELSSTYKALNTLGNSTIET